MATWPAVAAYKRRTHELLGDDGPVLDVGCGPGDDLVALGVGRAVGLDRSTAMCARARARGATCVRGEAGALPFRDSVFAGTRADRVVQHMDDVSSVLAEMVRVTRPGSPVVVADPDQGTLVIELDGVDRSIIDRLVALRRDVGYRQGRWIADATTQLWRLGLEVLAVDHIVLELDDPADAFGLPGWPRHWKDEGRFTDDEIATWERAVAEPAGFRYRVSYVIVAGRVPA